MNLCLYTDGACSRNGQENPIGGWAYIIVNADKVLINGYGREEGTTNQQMELRALIEGLKAIKKLDFFSCEVFSDSAYCINGINNGWIEKWRTNGWLTSKREPVKNEELWKELYSLYSDDERFVFTKVKGHSDNAFNNLVDQMAVNAKDSKYSF